MADFRMVMFCRHDQPRPFALFPRTAVTGQLRFSLQFSQRLQKFHVAKLFIPDISMECLPPIPKVFLRPLGYIRQGDASSSW